MPELWEGQIMIQCVNCHDWSHSAP